MVPAIAVADALRAEGAEVSFVGGERAEAELVPKAGYELDQLNVEGLSRTNPLKAARALGKAGAAVAQARKILKRRRGRRRARRRGIRGRPGRPRRGAEPGRRSCLAEADSHLGISNRALASRARRVCLAFPLEGRTGDRYLVTGRPVPPKITDRAHARAQLGIGPEETCVLVFGGSLGARSINQAAIEAFKDAPYRVVHVAGTRDYPDLTSPGAHYVLLDYLTPFGTALAAADAAVGRSGGSVFELAQYGLPSRPDPLSARVAPTTRARTRAGWPTPAPPASSPTRS